MLYSRKSPLLLPWQCIYYSQRADITRRSGTRYHVHHSAWLQRYLVDTLADSVLYGTHRSLRDKLMTTFCLFSELVVKARFIMLPCIIIIPVVTRRGSNIIWSTIYTGLRWWRNGSCILSVHVCNGYITRSWSIAARPLYNTTDGSRRPGWCIFDHQHYT